MARLDGSDPASCKRSRCKAELMSLALPSTIARQMWGAKLGELLHKLISERGHKQIFQTSDGRFADLEQDAMQKCLNEYFFKTQVKAGETFRNLDSLQESGGGQGDLAGRSVRMVSEVEPFAAQEFGGHSAHVDRWKPQV